MKAGMEGKVPPSPPPQLSRRARELSDSLQQQGVSTMDQMLEMIKQEMKRSLPPPAPRSTPPADDSSKPDYRT
jgi:hypothetical protein